MDRHLNSREASALRQSNIPKKKHIKAILHDSQENMITLSIRKSYFHLSLMYGRTDKGRCMVDASW